MLRTFFKDVLSFQGIVGDVLLDGKVLQYWGMFPITFEPKQLELLKNVPNVEEEVAAPCLSFANFQVDSDSADTYLKVEQWTKVRVTYFEGLYERLVGPNRFVNNRWRPF